jgi:hypothetical protein
MTHNAFNAVVQLLQRARRISAPRQRPAKAAATGQTAITNSGSQARAASSQRLTPLELAQAFWQ